VNANANNVIGRNACEIKRLQCLIDNDRIAENGRSSGSEHIEPPWRDDADAEGFVARIDEINSQIVSFLRT